MRERALLVGGEVRIQGVAGSGTSVVVTIPLQAVTAPSAVRLTASVTPAAMSAVSG